MISSCSKYLGSWIKLKIQRLIFRPTGAASQGWVLEMGIIINSTRYSNTHPALLNSMISLTGHDQDPSIRCIDKKEGMRLRNVKL